MRRAVLAGTGVALLLALSGCGTVTDHPVGAQRPTARIEPLPVPSTVTPAAPAVGVTGTVSSVGLRWTDGHVALPDTALTPGAVFPDVRKPELCQLHYAMGVRQPHFNDKLQVFTAYGIDIHDRDLYEVDHLIPVGLGGSNALTNLWPQPYAGPHGAHQKDALEAHLRQLVCSGRLALKTAQAAIAKNWWAAYQHYGVGGSGGTTTASTKPVKWEVVNGGPCPRAGAIGYSDPKHVKFTCKLGDSGRLAWAKRY